MIISTTASGPPGTLWTWRDGHELVGPARISFTAFGDDDDTLPDCIHVSGELVAGPAWSGEQDGFDGGEYTLESLTVTSAGAPITAAALSALSVPALIRAAVSGHVDVHRFDRETDDMIAEGIDPSTCPTPVVWALGRVLGANPTAFASEVLGLPYSTVAHQLVRARDRGQLPRLTKAAS